MAPTRKRATSATPTKVKQTKKTGSVTKKRAVKPPSPVPSSSTVSVASSGQGVIAPAVFSDGPEAAARRKEVDYSSRVTLEEALTGTARRQIRVYSDGVYDMFHSGHARQMMQAKQAFPKCDVYLIVGLASDATVHHYKGQTVMTEHERYEAVRHCRYVDEVCRDAPWETGRDFVRRMKIDFVAHDDLPYVAGDSADVYKWLKDEGLFVPTQRTEGISTTDVITRIIKDYNMYLRRNLNRGYSRHDLNVGFLKEKQLKMVDSVSSLLQYWENKSTNLIANFISLFERNGRIYQWLRDSN